MRRKRRDCITLPGTEEHLSEYSLVYMEAKIGVLQTKDKANGTIHSKAQKGTKHRMYREPDGVYYVTK